jgi:tetratricopeptide (TPR) repeat protein
MRRGMSRGRQFGWALSALLAGVCSSAEARAQSEIPAAERNELSRSHFRAGMRYFERGRFLEAAGEFERVFELSGQGALLYNAARAWEDGGRAREATRAYERYLATNAEGIDRAVVRAAIERLAERAREEERAEREGRCGPVSQAATATATATAATTSGGAEVIARTPGVGSARDTSTLLQLRTRVTYEHRAVDAIAPWVLVGIAGLTGGLAAWQGVASSSDAARVRAATTWSPELTNAYFASRDEGNTAIAFGAAAGVAAIGAGLWFIGRGAGERREEVLRTLAWVTPTRGGLGITIGGVL